MNTLLLNFPGGFPSWILLIVPLVLLLLIIKGIELLRHKITQWRIARAHRHEFVGGDIEPQDLDHE